MSDSDQEAKRKLYHHAASSLISRSQLLSRLGESHDGDREYYKTFGYKKVLLTRTT